MSRPNRSRDRYVVTVSLADGSFAAVHYEGAEPPLKGSAYEYPVITIEVAQVTKVQRVGDDGELETVTELADDTTATPYVDSNTVDDDGDVEAEQD